MHIAEKILLLYPLIFGGDYHITPAEAEEAFYADLNTLDMVE